MASHDQRKKIWDEVVRRLGGERSVPASTAQELYIATVHHILNVHAEEDIDISSLLLREQKVSLDVKFWSIMVNQKDIAKGRRSSYQVMMENAQQATEETSFKIFDILFEQKFDIDERWQQLGLAGIEVAEDEAISKLVKYCHKSSTLSRDSKVNKYAKRILDLHYSRSWA